MSAETFALTFVGPGTGAVARTIDAKLKDGWISVKDFGAVGDNVADDTAALLLAIAYINTVGGTLYFPKGTYRFSDTLFITGPANVADGFYGHITLQGDGDASTLLYTGTGVAIQYGGGGAIASIGTGDPFTVTTVAPHGLVTGKSVKFYNTATTPELDGTGTGGSAYPITVTGPTTFTVAGTNVTSGQAGAAGAAKVTDSVTNVRFLDLGLVKNGAAGTSIGFDCLAHGYEDVWENFWIEGFLIGLRCHDNNGNVMRNGTLISCGRGVGLGVAANLWKFDNVYFNSHTLVGLDIGYYDARFGFQAPPATGIEIIGCAFHLCLIPLVIGGGSTSGVQMLGCYVEDNTKGIQIGHNTADFSGLELEASTLHEAQILGTFVAQSANNVIVLNTNINHLLVVGMRLANLGGTVAVVKSTAAGTDAAGLYLQSLRSPVYEDSAGNQTARTGYQNAGVIQARRNSGNNGFLEIVRNAATDFSLARFFSTITAANPDFELGLYGTTDLAIVMAANGQILWKMNRTTGRNEVRAGFNNSTYAPMGGTLTTNTTAAQNTGAGEDNLMGYSVPASVLAVNGESIEFSASGTIANNVNAKQLRVKFGATTILDTGAGIPISAAIDWTIRGQIIRTGAATQKCMVTINTNNATIQAFVDYTTAAETLSGAVTLQFTGEAVSNGDIIQETLKVWWNP